MSDRLDAWRVWNEGKLPAKDGGGQLACEIGVSPEDLPDGLTQKGTLKKLYVLNAKGQLVSGSIAFQACNYSYQHSNMQGAFFAALFSLYYWKSDTEYSCRADLCYNVVINKRLICPRIYR